MLISNPESTNPNITFSQNWTKLSWLRELQQKYQHDPELQYLPANNILVVPHFEREKRNQQTDFI